MKNIQGAGRRWWEDEALLLRLVSDLVHGELASMRRRRVDPPLPWHAEIDLERDLGADSLERLALATALADLLHMHQSGHPDQLLSQFALRDWMAFARASLCRHAAQYTFRTSGSTGTPKRCTHAATTLGQEVNQLAALLPGRRRILSAVPSHHIYGFLFTVLLPSALRIDGLQLIDLRASSPAALLQGLRAGDLIVAHPQFWSAVAQLRPAFPPGVVGVTSTSPCPDALADALRAAGLDQLLQVYGSTETGGIGWRIAAGAPFLRFPYWQRDPEQAGALGRQLPDGSRAFYPLQDRLQWVDAERFLPAGRLDSAVQVFGTNVFPLHVARVLDSHPAVAEAVVRLMRPDEGARLKAFIVPQQAHADPDELRRVLDEWCRERLDAAARPIAWTFGAILPRKLNGKPADWMIEDDTNPATPDGFA